MRKISFLMAAHNEEKIIGKTLAHLIKLPYTNYEIILGLDGCTDSTEKIVKEFQNKSDKIRYYKLNLRQGKPAVIDKIMRHAKSEIVIINDADWLFTIRDKKTFEKFFSIFDNPKIGGIAESFPAEWKKDMSKADLGYKMTAYSNYLWLEFQKKNFSKEENGLRIITTPKMFLTNIFRRKLYRKNITLGDDFERTKDIMNAGYKIALFDNINMPRMIAVYDRISIKDLFNQKIRTAIARKQLGNENITFFNYYLPAMSYIFFNAWKKGIYYGLIVSFWIKLMVFATLISKFKKVDTKKGWKLRAER